MAKMSKKQQELTVDIEKYLELKDKAKELEKELEALKKKLTAEANSSESRSVIVGSHTISLSSRTRSSINVKEFTAAHPRLAAKFTNITEYDVLNVK